MVIISSVSLPSIASRSSVAGSALIPASLAVRLSSSWMVEETMRRSVTYFARNWSPSRRAVSTFSTSRLLVAMRACTRANCARSASCSRRRSSADPPNGLKAITAATRLAASSVPMVARNSTRGCLTTPPFQLSFPASLKFLGIDHRYPIAIERVRLRGRQAAVLHNRAEQRRLLQRLVKLDHRLRRVRSHRHIQHHLVLRVHRRPDGQHLHVVRNGLLQVGENPRPTDPFAVEQRIQKNAALQHLRVLRLP